MKELAVLELVILGTVPSAAEEALVWSLVQGDRDTNWKRARKHCEKFATDARTDWRLPRERELFELAQRTADGDSDARAAIETLGDAAAWSGDVSSSGLAWAASFTHGYLFRLYVANWRGLRALCVAGPAVVDSTEVETGPWLRPLAAETDSALTWPCTGELRNPVIQAGTLAPFRRAIPPGPLVAVVSVDFVIDAEGWVRFVGPTPETPSRYGALAVDTLMTFRFASATCDGAPIPIFHRLDFGGPPDEESPE
jgi:hypothetical protein